MTVTSANALSAGIGQNLVINGNFDFWQRASNPSSPSFSTAQYTADRWWSLANDTVTRESFSATPEVPNAKYFIRLNPVQSGGYHTLQQIIEDAGNVLSGKTATLTFWARSSKGGPFTLTVVSSLFGDYQILSNTAALTTTWQKYTISLDIPVTTGQSNHRYLRFYTGTLDLTYGFDLAQVKLEIGASATQFSLAGGTIPGELAACQRYYYRAYSASAFSHLGGLGIAGSTTNVYMDYTLPVPLRLTNFTIDSHSNLKIWDGTNQFSISAIAAAGVVNTNAVVQVTSSGLTQYRPYYFGDSGSGGSYIGFDAEIR